ncbi:MAG: ABC transporter permease [Proteobacteria bacterium]|nr:ABC transporter permease [Pseudomonadota bacterium]
MSVNQASGEILIESRVSLRQSLKLRELWSYRELIYFLSLRDIKVKYKQAVFGVAWVIVQPLFTVLTYTFLFGKVAKMASDGIPYSVFVFSALVPWTYFTSAMNKGSMSLVGSGALFSKVYFPRLVIPLAAVMSGLLDYMISFFCMVLVLAYYGIYPQWGWIVGVPAVTLWIFILSSGVSFWLGALNVKYRDVGHIIPFIVQIWMFTTPILYSISVIPQKFQMWIKLNPMYGLIETYRSVIFSRPIEWASLSVSLALTLIILVSGSVYFAKTERSFADII